MWRGPGPPGSTYNSQQWSTETVSHTGPHQHALTYRLFILSSSGRHNGGKEHTKLSGRHWEIKQGDVTVGKSKTSRKSKANSTTDLHL